MHFIGGLCKREPCRIQLRKESVAEVQQLLWAVLENGIVDAEQCTLQHHYDLLFSRLPSEGVAQTAEPGLQQPLVRGTPNSQLPNGDVILHVLDTQRGNGIPCQRREMVNRAIQPVSQDPCLDWVSCLIQCVNDRLYAVDPLFHNKIAAYHGAAALKTAVIRTAYSKKRVQCLRNLSRRFSPS